MSVEFSDYKHIVYSAEDLSELIMTTSQLISRIRDKTFANFDQLKDLKVEEMGYVTIIRSFENTFSFFMTFIENCKDLKMLFENNKFTSQYINQDLNLPEAEEAKAVISEYEFNEAEHRYLQHQEKFISNYSEQNQLLIQHFKEQLQNTEDFDDSIKAKISSIGLVFYKFNEYLKAIDLNCSNIIKCLDQSKSNENIEEYLIDMFYTDSLMKHFCELLFFSAEARDNSLFFKTPEDDEWVKLQPYIEYVEIREEDEIMKSYEKFSKWVILGISTFRKFENPNDITNIEELKNNIMKIFKVGFYGSIYFLSFKKRIQQYKYFVSNPDIKIACLLWNSIDLKFFSLFYNVAIPSVKLNQILYVPRLYSLLSTSLSDGQDSLLRMNDESNHSDNEESKRSHQIEFYADSSDDSSESSFHTNKNEFNNETHIMVRLLYNDAFTYNFKTSEFNLTQTQLKSSKKASVNPGNVRCCMPPIFSDAKGVKDIDKLIIHIHGGGFISMSSNSHQIYTRIWTRDTKIPVISIDYRLSPEYAYPCALDDCWQVYLWIINCSAEQLNINPKTIILVGDSAGGNIAASLTTLAIQHKVKIPDMLILPYPAMTLSKESMVPSIFYSLTDPILNLNFLNMCFDCYLKEDHDAVNDNLISPIKTPEEILKQFPPIRMMVGTMDPLRDIAYLFLQKCVDVGVDVKLLEFAHLPHGFLNYGIPVVGMNEVTECINKASEWILEACNNSSDNINNSKNCFSSLRSASGQFKLNPSTQIFVGPISQSRPSIRIGSK